MALKKMMEVYPTLPKFMVQECPDEDDLTDIDDEVFIRDGKNGVLKFDEDGGVKRPLMAPRKRYKKFYKVGVNRFPYKALFIPICYGLVALVILLGLIALCIYTVNIFPMSLNMLKRWIFHELKTSVNNNHIIPCTSLSSKIIWTRSIPKFTSEAPLRSNDVNKDGIEDIIIGFSTGLNAENSPGCYDYSENQVPCLGGVIALDGKTGNTSWIYWSVCSIFSVDCGLDITSDKINDCIALGENGVLYAINGQDGVGIWKIPNQELSEDFKLLQIYDAKFITDTDGDNIGDIIATGTIKSDVSHNSKMIIISAKKGDILNTINFSSMELFSAPQIIVHPDGENILVLTANNQMQSGALFIASSTSFMHDDLKLKELYRSSGKTALSSPVLADVTLDGVVDIIASMFDSTIIAYDGLTFDPIWNYTVPNSDILSIPIPGYYNDDNIPDFMVKHRIESEIPTLYYTISTIIDGKNGQPLLEIRMEDNLNKQMSGLSVTIDGFGNDWFLYWSGHCLNGEGSKRKFQFSNNKHSLSQKHIDLCKMKFNSTLATNLLALSQHVGPPGIILYSSEEYKILEFNNSIDIEKEIEKYLELYHDVDLVDTDNSKIYKDYEKGVIFTPNRDEDVLRESNNYHQKLPEMVYENSEHFEGDNKFDANFPLNNMENLNVENSLHQENKWITNNKIANNMVKEYDTLYDNDNNNDIGDDRIIDYPQMDELREQRSQVIDKLNDFENTNYIINKNTKNNVEKKSVYIKDVYLSKIREKRAKQSSNILDKRINYNTRKQQLSSILLPSFIDSKEGHSVDIVFSTFGSLISEKSITLSQEDLDCIYRKKVSSNKSSTYYKRNTEIITECLNEHADSNNLYEDAMKQNHVNIALGQMTVYRMKLECVCPEDMLPNQECKSIAPRQSWPEYLGLYGSGYFRPLNKDT